MKAERGAVIDNTDDSTSDCCDSSAVDEDRVQLVRKLSLDEFRKRLIYHFNIAFRRGEVQWPTK